MPNNRTLLLAIAAICFAVIGGALYFQHAQGMQPCPLCVIQRYAFLVAGLFALVAAFTRTARPWIALSLASAIGGAVTVADHLNVLAHPGFTCGIDPKETFLNKLPTAEFMPWMFKADGMCESAGDLILGLSIPQWSALTFGVIIAGLLLALLRRRAL